MALPRFQDNQRYLVEGKTLNEIFEAIQTAQIRKGPGYDLRVVPGEGTTLKIRPSTIVESRWDLVPVPEMEGYFHLRDPLIVAGITDLATTIEVTNDPITLAAGKWVVLEVDDPASSVPAYTLATKDRDNDVGLETYTFDGDDKLASVSLPLWEMTDTETPTAITFGENLYGVRYVSGDVLALVRHHVLVPDRPVSVYAHRLYPL